MLDEKPDVRDICAGSADSNEAMLGINRAMGYRSLFGVTTWELGLPISKSVLGQSSDGSPFSMKITISMPEPGQLLHLWWYGSPGEVPEERDRAELRLQPAP